jgi:translation initiation factor IF-2
VRAVFSAGKDKKVAGVYVVEGKVTRGVAVRVRRQERVLAESTIESLKRFQDAAKEVSAGYECGVGISGFSEFKEGDILEFFQKDKKVK